MLKLRLRVYVDPTNTELVGLLLMNSLHKS